MRRHRQRSIEENKLLVEKYPFLKPVDWRTREDLKEYNYTYTYADDMEGWWDAFGEMMCEELKQELIKYNFLYEFRVVQVKEKYGGLRFYHNGCPRESRIDDIIEKYSLLSENICVNCGKPDVPMINDGIWISPYCRDCCDDKDLWDATVKSEQNTMIGEKLTIKRGFGDLSESLFVDFIGLREEPLKTAMSGELKYTTSSGGVQSETVIDISKEADEIRRRYRNRIHSERSE